MKLFHKIKGFFPTGLQDQIDLAILRYQRSKVPDSGTQKLLLLNYKKLAQSQQTCSFREVGFCGYSGSDEDGVLLYIFSLIGVTNQQFVDIGAAGVGASNTANLVINHSWYGLHIDGNSEVLRKAQSVYAKTPGVQHMLPKAVSAYVSAENINELVQSNGFEGSLDLLSLDIDGNDYWVWKALDCIQPRVVIAEYQPAITAENAWTTPYDPEFNCDDFPVNQTSGEKIYAGASLAALTKLANEKGYRLVGCNAHGVNAFFVQHGEGEQLLPEVTVESCLDNPRALSMQHEYKSILADLEWIKV